MHHALLDYRSQHSERIHRVFCTYWITHSLFMRKASLAVFFSFAMIALLIYEKFVAFWPGDGEEKWASEKERNSRK